MLLLERDKGTVSTVSPTGSAESCSEDIGNLCERFLVILKRDTLCLMTNSLRKIGRDSAEEEKRQRRLVSGLLT